MCVDVKLNHGRMYNSKFGVWNGETEAPQSQAMINCYDMDIVRRSRIHISAKNFVAIHSAISSVAFSTTVTVRFVTRRARNGKLRGFAIRYAKSSASCIHTEAARIKFYKFLCTSEACQKKFCYWFWTLTAFHRVHA